MNDRWLGHVVGGAAMTIPRVARHAAATDLNKERVRLSKNEDLSITGLKRSISTTQAYGIGLGIARVSVGVSCRTNGPGQHPITKRRRSKASVLHVNEVFCILWTASVLGHRESILLLQIALDILPFCVAHRARVDNDLSNRAFPETALFPPSATDQRVR